MGGPSDLDIGHALAAGDLDAFSRVYDTYGVPVYSVALRMLRDPQRAEDLVFDCFLQLWKHPESYDPSCGSLRDHLIASIRQLALGALTGRPHREPRRVDVRGRDGARRASDPWEGADSAEVGQAIREGLAGLPAEQREALELACFAGYNYQEIAEATQEPLTGVKSTMRQALEKLHSYLQVRGLVHET